MTLVEKVTNAKSLDDEIQALENQKKELEEKIKLKTTQRAEVYSDLLLEAKSAGIKDEKLNDLFLTYFSKEEITWLDDKGLLTKLQENGANEFIKTVTKTTVSVDKNALKKAFKTNQALKEEYRAFYGNRLTEYVTVTTEENHTKMLNHIQENKNVEQGTN